MNYPGKNANWLLLLLMQLPWHSTVAQDDDPTGLLLRIVALERTRFEKRACDERYPQFHSEIDAAFRAYPDAKLTAQQIIESSATSEMRRKLLQALPEAQAGIQADVLRLHTERPQLMQQSCANLAAAIKGFTTKAPAQQGAGR